MDTFMQEAERTLQNYLRSGLNSVKEYYVICSLSVVPNVQTKAAKIMN